MISEQQLEERKRQLVSIILVVVVAIVGVYYLPTLFNASPDEGGMTAAPPGDRSAWPARGVYLWQDEAEALAEDSRRCGALLDIGLRWVHIHVPAWLPEGARRFEYGESDLAELEASVLLLRERGFAVALEATAPSRGPHELDDETVERVASSYGGFLRDVADCAAASRVDLLHLGPLYGHPAFPAGFAVELLAELRARYPGSVAMSARDEEGIWRSFTDGCDWVTADLRWDGQVVDIDALPAVHGGLPSCIHLEGQTEAPFGFAGTGVQRPSVSTEDARAHIAVAAKLASALRLHGQRQGTDAMEIADTGFCLDAAAVFSLLDSDPAALQDLRGELRLLRQQELHRKLNTRKPEMRQSPASDTQR